VVLSDLIARITQTVATILHVGYPRGYDYDTTRCCGQTGATGCKINAAGFYSGCCVHTHHCEWRDETKKTTWCMPTLYKKKRTIESFIFN
jgi:hypothetical protein